MGQRADGNEIHAGPRHRAHGFQSHAAAGFGLSATGHPFHRAPQLRRGHVVEQDDVRAGGNGLGHLRERVGFHFDLQSRKFFPRASHGGGDGVGLRLAQGGEVVVLDEHEIVKPEAVIAPAAAGHGVFLEASPAGSGLPRVEDLCLGAAHGVGELRRERGDTGEALDKIQRHALRRKDGPGRAGNQQKPGPGAHALSVPHGFFDANRRGELTKRRFRETESRNDERFPRPQHGAGAGNSRNGRPGRRVASAEVFNQRRFHGTADFIGTERFHAGSMAANKKAEKEKDGGARGNAVGGAIILLSPPTTCEPVAMNNRPLQSGLNRLRTILVLAALLAASAPAAETNRPHHVQWEPAIRAFEAADKTNAPPTNAVLFIGSSSIRKWTNAPAQFPGHKIINRGFGGSHLSDSAAFAERIAVPYSPKVVVLYAGDNDLAAGKTPAQVFASFKEFVAKVHAALPETRIAFIAIKPCPARVKMLPQAKETNQLIWNYIAGKDQQNKLTFIDIFPPSLTQDGRPRADLYLSDGLHPNATGYELWATLVKPVLDKYDPPLSGKN